jgi:hypothetical protein
MRTARVLAWVSSLLVVGACAPRRSFKDACERLERGTTLEQVDAAMGPVGGVRSFVGESWMWQRETLLFGTDVCEPELDRRDRVVKARYRYYP